MSSPAIPPQLGQKVTTRLLDYRSMVIQLWGEEWSKPDIAYEFSSGYTKDDTTLQGGAWYHRGGPISALHYP